jgi:peptidoglycan/xylan/chitin deacetylase (PgdA/CDA1 family)
VEPVGSAAARPEYALSSLVHKQGFGVVKPYNVLRSVIRLVRTPRPQPIILMYHRIARAAVDPWGLSVSPDLFEQHLDILRRTRSPVSLGEFVRGLDAGSLPADAVAITFDDGYADNLFNAKPLLVARNVPATVFLITGYLGRTEEYWWDELARLILLGSGPEEITYAIRGSILSFKLGPREPREELERWRVWKPPLTERHAAYLAIWRVLQPLPDAERACVMDNLRSTLSCESNNHSLGRAMSHSEVRRLVDGGLIAVGAHTVTHPSLPGLDRAACEREFLESKDVCERLAGTPILGFAYPYGHVDAKVQRQAKVSGFAYAVSTVHAPVMPRSDRYVLPRIQVSDRNGSFL